MNKPGFRTRILGNPLVVLLSLAVGGLGLYGWWRDYDQWLPGVFGFLLIGAALKAHDEVAKYEALQRAWDSAGGGGAARRRSPWSNPGMRLGALIALVVFLAIYLAENRHEPGYDLALGWLAIGSAGAAIGGIGWTLARRARRPRQRAADDWDYAEIMVARPLLPTPGRIEIYETLPDHCRRLMRLK